MHMVQLISDAIYYLQESRTQDTQWTQRSPIGPGGFQLWLWAFVSLTGCPSPQQGHTIMTLVSMHIAQLISDVVYCLQGSRPQDTQWTRRSPIGSWDFHSDYGPLSVLRSARHPQQGHQAPCYLGFHQEVLHPPGRRRARHHSSGQQAHRHHL